MLSERGADSDIEIVTKSAVAFNFRLPSISAMRDFEYLLGAISPLDLFP